MAMSKYPNNLNLAPDGDLHRSIVNRVMDCARRGWAAGEAARQRAREIDRTLKAFVPARWTDKFLGMRNYENPEAPLEIVVPVSKNARDTFLTYMAGAFLSEFPNLYYLQGRGGPQGMIRAALFERLLNTQAVWFQHDISYMTFWSDMFSYGVGCLVPEWSKHRRREPAIAETSEVLSVLLRRIGVNVSEGDLIRYLDERIVHEGNRLTNCSFYSLILDPNVSITNQENAEFCGWVEQTNIPTLLKRASDPEERLFNIEQLRDYVKGRGGGDVPSWSIDYGASYGYPKLHDGIFPGFQSESCRLVHVYYRCIPKELGIGKEDRPELIEFVVGEGNILVGMRRVDYDHGRLPMVLGSPSHDGYETFPLAELASTYGMQQFCDWKLRAQVANQAKVLNDMLLVDTSMFEEEDLLNPAPGKLIRVKRSLMGLGAISQFVQQLNVQDVTAGNLSDVMAMTSFMNQLLGTSDIVMGDLSKLPERPTAALGMAARQSALSRLQYMAQKIVGQTHYQLVSMMTSNTLQFMAQDVMLSIAGTRYEQDIRRELGLPEGYSEILVGPWDLDLDFDIIPQNKMVKDGDISVMSSLVERMLSIPEIAMDAFSGIDLRGLMLAFMRKSGFENVHEYLKKNQSLPPVQATQMPDEQVLAEQQAGNLVPMDEVLKENGVVMAGP